MRSTPLTYFERNANATTKPDSNCWVGNDGLRSRSAPKAGCFEGYTWTQDTVFILIRLTAVVLSRLDVANALLLAILAVSQTLTKGV